MKKLILASVSAMALLGVAACSDSGTDTTTTQSVTPPVEAPADPATPATPGQEAVPTPETGTGGDTQMQTVPSEPAPAQ